MSGSAEAVMAQAHERWPDLDLARYRDRLTAFPAALCPVDLLLAAACLADDRQAIRILEDEALAGAFRHLQATGHAPTLAQEAIQVVRRKLLMTGEGGAPPALEAFAGEGSLVSFVRVIAVHAAASLSRKAPADETGDDQRLAEQLAAGGDAEHGLLRAEVGSVLRAALAVALRQLTARERALLRFHFLDGLGVDALARIYGAHRATCARWLAAARTRLGEEVKAHLREALEHSGLDLTYSQVELGLSGLLRGA
jgi:RNA polymerase sigma-70 factor (ECF subfamily)